MKKKCNIEIPSLFLSIRLPCTLLQYELLRNQKFVDLPLSVFLTYYISLEMFCIIFYYVLIKRKQHQPPPTQLEFF